MSEQTPPWMLISVLFSSVPLSPALAMTLHQAAFDLHRKDAGGCEIGGDMVSGKVRNLRKDLVLGTLAGPAFEAEVDTERGSGMVRFLLTRQGIEAMAQRESRRPPRQLLN